jgi:O-methyltransferase
MGVVQKAAHGLGYHVRRLNRSEIHITRTDKSEEFPDDFMPEDIEVIRSVKPYTLTGVETIYALIEAVRYVVRNNIPGDIVECGVWKGGSMMAVARTLLSLKETNRHIYLLDTFEGNPEPGEMDVSRNGKASERFAALHPDRYYASLDEVQRAMYSTGYDASKLHFVKGLVEQTVPGSAPDCISLLRLDTDWYESTRHELTHLFPRLSRGGVIIIDDYGYWLGARKATDDYISQNNLRLLLHRIGGPRIAVKM